MQPRMPQGRLRLLEGLRPLEQSRMQPELPWRPRAGHSRGQPELMMQPGKPRAGHSVSRKQERR